VLGSWYDMGFGTEPGETKHEFRGRRADTDYIFTQSESARALAILFTAGLSCIIDHHLVHDLTSYTCGVSSLILLRASSANKHKVVQHHLHSRSRASAAKELFYRICSSCRLADSVAKKKLGKL